MLVQDQAIAMCQQDCFLGSEGTNDSGGLGDMIRTSICSGFRVQYRVELLYDGSIACPQKP